MKEGTPKESLPAADAEGFVPEQADFSLLRDTDYVPPLPSLEAPARDELLDTGELPPIDIPTSTVARHALSLLGPTPYTLAELARRAGTTVEAAAHYWGGMGYTLGRHDRPRFGDMDVAALRRAAALIENGVIDNETSSMLLRAGQLTDRLVLWQVESVVADIARRLNVDDTTARLVALDRMGEMFEELERQLVYTWRRQMVALLARLDTDVSQAGVSHIDPEVYPLHRTLGFVDMVSFSRHSAQVGAAALAELIGKFELICRDVITAHGARVVKTIGDAVLFVADNVETGVEVALLLMEALRTAEGLLPMRASVVDGHVFSRYGDVFGPTVNLAARLVDVADPGCLFTDEATAQALSAPEFAGRYVLKEREPMELQGLGEVQPFALFRAENHTCGVEES